MPTAPAPLDLAEIVSVTTVGNARSMRVMERLGMHRDPAADFEHPNLPSGHPLRPHVLYRLTREEWNRIVRERSSGLAPPLLQR